MENNSEKYQLIVVMIYQSPLGAMESIFGGWAMMSPDVQQWRAYVSIGWIMTVIGIIIMIPAIILKEKEIQLETHSEKVIPKKPKRDLRKSPTLKGIVIGIIAVSIIWVSTLGLTYQTFTMATDIDAMGIKKGDLVRFDNTPFHEIQINDTISYYDNNEVLIHKVISVDSSKVPRTLTAQSMVSNITNLITIDQYIGKLDSVIVGMGSISAVINTPGVFFIILISAFAIPIIVMKIRG